MNILWLTYQKGQIFEQFKLNENFIAMAKEFGISKSTILFKISIAKFVNKYPRMIKSSLHFLKNNLVNLNRSGIFLKNIFILKLFKK